MIRAAVEDFGEGVFHQGQGARLLADLRYDRCRQPGFQAHAHALSGGGDSALQLFGRHGRDDFGALPDELGEIGNHQWAIIEIRA